MNFEQVQKIQFKPSESNKRTEDILKSRPQVERKQWIRSVKTKLIRPQILQEKPSRVAICYLLEFADPGVLTSICLDFDFPARLNHYLGLTLPEIETLLSEEEWTIHKSKQKLPFWLPKIELNKPPKGYVYLTDDSPDKDLVEEVTEVPKLRSQATCAVRHNEKILPPQYRERNAPKNITDLIKQIGARKFLGNVKKVFYSCEHSDMKCRKLSMINPFELQTQSNSQIIYDESELENINPDLFHPFLVNRYKENMNSGN